MIKLNFDQKLKKMSIDVVECNSTYHCNTSLVYRYLKPCIEFDQCVDWPCSTDPPCQAVYKPLPTWCEEATCYTVEPKPHPHPSPSLDNGAIAAISLVCIGIFFVSSGVWARKYPDGNVSMSYQWIWYALKVGFFLLALALMKIVTWIFDHTCAKCTENDDRRNLLENGQLNELPLDNAMPLAGLNIQQPYPENLNPFDQLPAPSVSSRYEEQNEQRSGFLKNSLVNRNYKSTSSSPESLDLLPPGAGLTYDERYY